MQCITQHFTNNRYALALRIMLANLRRKLGITSGLATPVPNPALDGGLMDATATSGFPAGSTNPQPLAPAPAPPQAGPSSEPLPFTFEELGFPWPADRGMETVPLWLQVSFFFPFHQGFW